MARVVLTPSGSGITAVTGIAAPAAGYRIKILGWLIMGTATGSVYLSSAATPIDASILDSLYVVAGGGALNHDYAAGPVAVPAATALFVVAAAGSLYGHIDYIVEKA